MTPQPTLFRTGTVDPRNQSGSLDTSALDAQIAEAQKRLGSFGEDRNYTKRALTSNQREQNDRYQDTGTGGLSSTYGWFDENGSRVKDSVVEAQKQKAQQRAEAQANLNALNKQRADFIASQGKADISQNQIQGNQALKSAAISESGTADANKTANISGGINRSLSGIMGSQNASKQTANVANPMYSANSSSASSTQADYLEKMGQAKALDTQAGALNKSAGLASLASGIQGFGSGASVGAALATSDENCKEKPEVSTEDLLEKVSQFMELYDKLQKLKENK